jgi:WD40 repeat protein
MSMNETLGSTKRSLSERRAQGKGRGRYRAALFALCVASAAIAAPALAEKLPTDPLLRIEAGMHTSVVKAVSLSADEKLAATGTDDKTVRLWSVPDGRLLRTFRMPVDSGNGGKVFAVALSPDGSLVAAAGWDAAYEVEQHMYVTLFDARTGAMLGRLGPLPNIINILEFSPDGGRLVAGFGGRSGVKVWAAPVWTEALSDAGYGDQVYGANFAADGRLTTASYDGNIRLYDANLQLRAKRIASGGHRPHGVAFSPDGQAIAVGYDDSTNVDVVNAGNLTKLFSADTRGLTGGALISVAWSADGQRLFAGGTHWEGEIRPVYAWPNGGRGARFVASSASSDVVRDLRPYGRSGVAFGSGDPAFGMVGDAGNLAMFKGPVTADLRGARGQAFAVSRDVRRVRFGLKQNGVDPFEFDAAQFNLIASPVAPPGLHPARIDGLSITEWVNYTTPKLNGKGLPLEQFEISRAIAILPDASGFILGADWHLRRFDSLGKEVWEEPVPGSAWGVNLSDDGQIVVVAYGDGTIRWHRTSDGKELLALFVQAQDKRWVAWTPSGYYAASPGGEDLIGWHVNRGLEQAPDFFPGSRFRDRFYRPDIVQSVLNTLDEAKAVEEADAAAHRKRDTTPLIQHLPPVITVKGPATGATFSAAGVTLDYDLRSPSGSPVDAVDVLIDGRPAAEARGFERVAAGTVALGAGHVNVTLPPRNVSVALIAHSGALASEPAAVNLLWAGAAPASADANLLKPKLYGLFIGISKYQDDRLQLGLAAKDAHDLAEALKAQSGKLYGGVETRVLIDQEATRGDILDGLEWLEKQVTSRDIGVIFLAGHGMTDEHQNYWFLPDDARIEKLRATAVAQEDIQRTLRGLPGKAILFLDTCHSGQVLASADGAKSRGIADVTAVVNELTAAENGVVAFASSTGREVSLERPEWGNGAFTKALIEGLGGKADLLHNGAITLSELDAYVVNRVKDLTGGAQHAVMLRPSTVSDYPIALIGD